MEWSEEMSFCGIAGWGSEPCLYLDIHTKCFSCGQFACRNCSKVVAQYYKWKKKRICLPCFEEHTRFAKDGKMIES